MGRFTLLYRTRKRGAAACFTKLNVWGRLTVYWRRVEELGNPGAVALALAFSCAAQPAATSMAGTVVGFGTGTQSIVVKADNGQSVAARLTPDTIAQRIVPGEKDLKNAVPVQVSDVAIGDRVLLTMDGEAGGALRIIVMSATDISKRNEADRLEWTRRGVNGIAQGRRDRA